MVWGVINPPLRFILYRRYAIINKLITKGFKMAGRSAQGTAIRVDTIPLTAYTDVECTVSFSFEDVEAATIDTTCLSSVAHEKVLGLTDPGTFGLSFNVSHSDPGYMILKAGKVSGDALGFEVELPTEGTETKGRTFTFEGYVKALPWTGAVDAAITGDATIEISGAVTETDPVTP